MGWFRTRHQLRNKEKKEENILSLSKLQLLASLKGVSVSIIPGKKLQYKVVTDNSLVILDTLANVSLFLERK